jgi:hypothetical protein
MHRHSRSQLGMFTVLEVLNNNMYYIFNIAFAIQAELPCHWNKKNCNNKLRKPLKDSKEAGQSLGLGY